MTADSQSPAGDRRPDGKAAAGAAAPGIFDGAGDLVHELRGVAHDYLTLAALETKRAGQSLVIMIAAGVMMAILLVSGWLGLVAAAVFGLVAAGMPPGFAILLAVAANVLVAVALYFVIRYKRRYLAYPATLRNLKPRGGTTHADGRRYAEGVH